MGWGRNLLSDHTLNRLGPPAVTPVLPRCSSWAGWGMSQVGAPRLWVRGLPSRERASSARRTSPAGQGPARRRRVRPGGREPALPPAAGPHVVDDHGLVGDDIVGLHGPAGPGRPCPAGRRQEGLANRRAGRRTGPRQLQRPGRAPPTRSAQPTPAPALWRARPAANHRSHLARLTARSPGQLRARGRSLRELTNQLRSPGRTVGALLS